MIKMKKIISAMLIPSLIFYLSGCYSMAQINKEDFITKNEKGKIVILTKDLKTYLFKAWTYQIQSDTLYGFGYELNGSDNKIPYKGKIAIDNIISVNMERIDVGTTVLLSIGILIGIALLLGTIVLIQAGNELSNLLG